MPKKKPAHVGRKPEPKPKKPRKKRTNFKKRSYRDDERMAAIAACNAESVLSVSKRMRIPEPTVRAWKEGYRRACALEMYEESKGDLAKAFDKVAWDAVGLAMQKSEGAPYRDLIRSAAIAVDKGMVIRGKPTVISQSHRTTIDLTKLTDEQLQQYRRIIEIAGREDAVGSAGVARVFAFEGGQGDGEEGPQESEELYPDVLGGDEPGA